MSRFRTDVWQTWRTVAARRGSAAAIVSVLTIGLGLAATIFAIADQFLFRPLPYPSAHRLIVIQAMLPPEEIGRPFDGSAPTLREWQNRTDLFEAVEAFSEPQRVRVTSGTETMPLTVRRVSPGLLALLGLSLDVRDDWRPSAGEGPRPIAVRARLPRSPHPVGSDIESTSLLAAEDGQSFRVAHVLPSEFVFPDPGSGAQPDALEAAELGPIVAPDVRNLPAVQFSAIARLQPNLTVAEVEAALTASLQTAAIRLRVQSLDRHMLSRTRPLALGTFAATSLILLACLANVMNLMITRGLHRRQEFVTREALGACRSDLFRLVVLDTAGMISVAAVASGLVAAGILLWSADSIPGQYTLLGQPTLTARGFGFIVVAATLIVGACLLPAWLSSTTRPSRRAGRTAAMDSRRLASWRLAMIAAQATVAMVLAIGATFLIRSHANLWSQDTGYAADARIVAVSYPRTISPGRLAEDALACMESLRRIPGVSDVAAAIGVGTLLDDFAVFGGDRIRTHDGSFFLMPTSKVTSNYFDVVGTPFIAGRAFAADDRLWSGVVVTDVFARRLWPDRTATEVVGESVVVMDASLAIDHVAPIVGVVAGVRDRALDRPPVARLYRPLDIGTSIPRRMNYAIRSTSSVVPIGEITRVVSTVTPGAYVERVDAVGTLLSETVKDRTFVTLVATLFGVASVGVTCGGVLAVVSFAAARRTREMAIRAALGARPNAIRYLILGPSLGAAFVGAAIGWVIARLSTAAIEAYLYGVGADSLSVPIVAGLTLMVLTGAAAWWPTRRVIRAQPSAVLRID